MPETPAPAVPEKVVVPSPSYVGNSFMHQYYHFLAKEPESLHRFYKAESRWCHGVGSHMEEPIAGQRAINEQILKRGYAGAHVDLDAGSIDCQNSLGEGVLVLVTGVMTLPKSPAPKPFVQTFFLAVQPNGYFVLNDCLRFLELPGVISVDVALDVPANGKKIAPPPSPVKKLQKEATPVPISPTKEMLPVKSKFSTTKTKEVAPVSPVKAGATVASSPVKKTTPKEEVTITPVVKTPSPVKSPEKQDKAPVAAASPTSAVVPVAAPADPVVPVPAEPEKPKTWAALFSGPKAAATVAPSAAPASTPTKPATPKTTVAPVSAPSPATVTPSAVLPSMEMSPKNKASSGTEKDLKRLHSLFIRDVPAQTRESDLRELFKSYGSIAGVSVVAQRGFAFIDYYEQESMRAALAETKELKVYDKVLQVDERAERKENQRGSFRSNDSRGRGRGFTKGGRGERKERSGDEASFPNKGERREFTRREKAGTRRAAKVDATSNRAE